MPKGYCGKILHVDLTSGAISVEEPDEKFYRRYMGGKGFAGRNVTLRGPWRTLRATAKPWLNSWASASAPCTASSGTPDRISPDRCRRSIPQPVIHEKDPIN